MRTGEWRVAGRGTAAIERCAAGGRLVVEGRGADAAAMRAEIDCTRFTGVESVGG